MIIDTHAHLNFKAFDNDFKKVIDDCLIEDVWMINVGSQLPTSEKAVQIAQGYDKGVYAAVGLHPIHAKEGLSEEYKKLAQSEKVVAIGEVGLDYLEKYRLFEQEQRQVLIEQISLALELSLPLIFHCREAHDDLIKVIRDNHCPPGVIHCFTGSWGQAQEYLDLGFFLGFNGIIYKRNLEEVIKKTPLDRMLLETDSPYLGKEKRNTPIFVIQVAKEVARRRGVSFEEVRGATTENARRLFGI